ncbi:MAG: flagellar biosynthesis anti-sigma factor FlgM [Bryobacteraceae bacterium]
MPDSRSSDPKTGPQGTAAARAKAVEFSAPATPTEEEPSDGREARIAELRKQVQDGTYKPDAAKTGAKIVDDQLK